MGLLALNQRMSFWRRRRQRERRRRPGQIRDPNGFVSSFGNGKRSSHRDNGSPKGGKKMRYSGPDLPEDIWRHIHSLMPLRDAARAALVSHAFLDSWRCRPNITFCGPSLGFDKDDVHGEDEIARDFNSKVNHILKKHSGIGLKSLKIYFCGYNADTHCYLNSWLNNAITPELEELTLVLPLNGAKYCFPSSLLSNGSGNSIQHLHLSRCTFSSTAGLDCLKNLKTLSLNQVPIIGDELCCLLLNSTALEDLDLLYCNKISRLNIPFLMKRLSCIRVFGCDKLQVIEIEAPNISTFYFSSDGQVQVSLAGSSHVKHITLGMHCAISYACVKLPSVAPNLDTLRISSSYEAVSTPMSPSKFLHLRFLNINLFGAAFSRAYDCFSVVSFLDAAPSLESFVLGVSHLRMQHDSIVGDPSPLRQMAGQRHNNLKTVTINGFCSARILVELACYILENAASLDCLTLDSNFGFPRCSEIGKCLPMERDMVMESKKALLVIGSYIKDKVPPSVKLNVLGPCSLCQDLQL